MSAASHGAADRFGAVLARGSLQAVRRRPQPTLWWRHVLLSAPMATVVSCNRRRRWYGSVGGGSGVASKTSAEPAESTTPTRHAPVPPPQEVAILGGGLTGLVTAHYLAELLPATARITLYESSDRLGGWIDSEAWEGQSAGSSAASASASTSTSPVILEAGARMVAPQRNSPRYDDMLFLDLVDRLDLVGSLRVCDERPAQYVYYPDHLVNVSMGSGIGGGGGGGGDTLLDKASRVAGLGYRVLTEPVFSGLLGAVYGYLMPSRERTAEVRRRAAAAYAAPSGLPPDDSVGGFALRQLGGGSGGRALVDNLLSAVMHGIYGGDVWRLSVASSPFRGSWIREGVAPLLTAYVRQAAAAAANASAANASAAETISGAVAAPSPSQLDHLAAIASGKYALAQDRDMEMLVDLLGSASPSQRLLRLAAASTGWTAMGFAGGFGTLTDALARRLVSGHDNVTLRLGAEVRGLALEEDGGGSGKQKVVVSTAAGRAAYDKVISTLASPALHAVTGGAVPALSREHAVTIMVVNLHYAEAGLNGTHRGFGYLVPQTVPLAENPEGALGVIFDTDREEGQRRLTEEEAGADGSRASSAASTSPGTTFTVMLGGHYWDGYAPDDYPTDDQAVAMAEAVVRRHLGPAAPLSSSSGETAIRPVATRAKLCRACIPQHYVGHADRMAAAHAELDAAFAGRLAVAGGSFTATGPGVLPSIRSARDVALRTAGRGYRLRRAQNGRNETDMAHVGDTGLGRFGNPLTDGVSPVPLSRLPLRFGNGIGKAEARGWGVKSE